MNEKTSRSPNACLHCHSLDTVVKGDTRRCNDCGAVSQGDEILRPGSVDLQYSLEIRGADGRLLWCDSLDRLFEAQCDVAAGLGIKPGSSFTKWLKSRERAGGVIDDSETILTMRNIVGRLMKHIEFVKEDYNRETIGKLDLAMKKAVKLLLTFGRR